MLIFACQLLNRFMLHAWLDSYYVQLHHNKQGYGSHNKRMEKSGIAGLLDGATVLPAEDPFISYYSQK